MFSEHSIFIIVELEGLHVKKGDVVFTGDSGGTLTYV